MSVKAFLRRNVFLFFVNNEEIVIYSIDLHEFSI